MPAVLRKQLPLSRRQHDFIHCGKRFRAFIGGRGSGKTYAMSADVILRAANTPGTYLCVAPTAQILREGMQTALGTISEQLGIRRKSGGNPFTLTLINGSQIICRTARNPELLRGGNYSGAVLDEAALLHPATKDIVLAALREKKRVGWMSYGSTPKGRSNWLFGEVHAGRCEMFKAHSRDNPFVDEEQVESLIATYDDFFRRQEIEAEFVDDCEETQVLPTAWVEQAMQRGEPAQLPPLSALGVDTARGGASRFTIAFRHGYCIPRLTAFPGARASTSQAGAALVLNALGEDRNATVNLDISGGTGSGVFDLLREVPSLKARAVNFGAGSSATDRTGRYRFANVRARLYWSLREALDPCGGVNLKLPDNFELAAELTAVHWTMSGSGAILLQPKEQIAKVLRRSPDLADAVALTMYN